MTPSPDTATAVRAVLRNAIDLYRDHPQSLARLQRHLDRMDEPLRVAIAGKVKAGKSTLLNALVGEEIAPTDAGECTRVLTWYNESPSPRVTLYPITGEPRRLPVRRADGRLQFDLAGTPPEDVDRLVVGWPSRSLRTSTLIDTPGIASLSTETSARSTTFLTPDDEPSPADAIIYLMRHLHSTDVRFLESFHDRAVGSAAMINTIGVLSRADEIGSGRIDALLSAQRVARRYCSDVKVRSLCQTVLPVAGLLAQTGRTLRQGEFTALQELSRESRAVVDQLLLSVDRFTRADAPVSLSAETRAGLLDRLGLFGIRLATTLVRHGSFDASSLAADLVRRSGLDELRRVLAVHFTERGDLLKARSALLAVERVLREQPRSGAEIIIGEVERISSSAHEFRELRLLAALRAPGLTLAKDAVEEAERLLGGQGTSPAARLGLPADAGPEELRSEALEVLRRWQLRAESPLSDRSTSEAARVVIRSCEGLLTRVVAA